MDSQMIGYGAIRVGHAVGLAPMNALYYLGDTRQIGATRNTES